MINIAICCNDKDKIYALCMFIEKYLTSKNSNYNLHKYTSLDELFSEGPKDLNIVFLNISSINSSLIQNIDYKLKSLYLNIKIIFIPEIFDFMINGFCLKNYNFILKPFDYGAFEIEFIDCLKSLNYNLEVLDSKNKKISKANLSFNNKDTHCKLDNLRINSTLFIKSKRRKCIAYSSNSNSTLDLNINELNNILSSHNFFRCHENYLVNLSKISKLNKNSLIINTTTIPISPNRFNELKNKLLILLNII